MKSLKVFITAIAIYPYIGYAILLLGSMLQKGLVSKYAEALDVDFSVFSSKFRASSIIQQVIAALNVGTGVMFNLSARARFRAPCYANTVVVVVLTTTFTALAVSAVSMMCCPYSYEYGIRTSVLMGATMTTVFEKIPRLLYEYQNRSFWLILIFSCHTVIGVSSNVVHFYSLMELTATRSDLIARNPGITALIGVILMFVVTVPLLGPFGMNIFIFAFRRYLHLTSTFFVMMECLVFIIWYGFDRFSEDVHFMQGIQPKTYMKLMWLVSSVVLAYVFINEMRYQIMNWRGTVDLLGLYMMFVIFVAIILTAVIKLLIATCKKRFLEMIQLDPSWSPSTEILQRSRAMFSAQAMTKEYMYRQYHLQAGIDQRQRRANVRIHRDCHGHQRNTI